MDNKQLLNNLDRAHEIYKNNCEGCKKNIKRSVVLCNTCPFGIEMRKVGILLTRSRKEKISTILKKGMDMTKREVIYLLENDVQREVIRKAIGLNFYDFKTLMHNWGLSVSQVKRMEVIS